MKLIDLSLILLILASYSDGQGWTITVRNEYKVVAGSNLTIPCKFTVPPEENNTDVKVTWKAPGTKKCKDKFNDAFILHWDEPCVDDKYRGRTRLVGNAAKGDCSLRIFNIMENVPRIYMRVFAKMDNYSFNKQPISISLKGVPSVTKKTELSGQPFFTTMSTTKLSSQPFVLTMTTANPSDTSNLMYMGIFVPVTAVVVILLVAGIVFCIRHKRSKSFTREESGYYANFSRASSDPPKRELSDNKDKELPDEPIYINVEEPKCEMDQNIPVTENVYGNVDYTV